MALHVVLALLCTAPPAAADDAGPELRIVRRSRPLFGAVVEALAAARSDEAARAAAGHLDAAFAEMARVEALLDESSPSSSIAALNGGTKTTLDPETYAVLDEAVRVAKLSKGAFDPTAAAYGDLWTFDAAAADGGTAADDRRAAPSKEQLAGRRGLVGWQDVVLDGAARTAQLRRAGARLSLAPVAKAYALDRAAAILAQRGVEDFLLTAGGDLVVRGKKGDKPWMIGVQDPRAPDHFAALPARAGAVATVGDYERFFFAGGARLHDVLDPKTGLPAAKVRSVTVSGPEAVAAEAIARAAFVMGPKDGVALVERLKGVEAVMVTSDNRVLLTSGLKGAVQYRPPTDAP